MLLFFPRNPVFAINYLLVSFLYLAIDKVQKSTLIQIVMFQPIIVYRKELYKVYTF